MMPQGEKHWGASSNRWGYYIPSPVGIDLKNNGGGGGQGPPLLPGSGITDLN